MQIVSFVLKNHPGKHVAHVVLEATVKQSSGPTSHVSATLGLVAALLSLKN
jgi:hypothetical protein